MTADSTGLRGLDRFARDLRELWWRLRGEQPAPNDGNDNDIRLVASEAVRVLRAYAVLYLLAFLLLVGYKWQTKGYYQADYDRRLAAFLQQNHERPVPWWTVQQELVEESMTGIRELGRLQDAELKNHAQRQQQLEALKETLEGLDFAVPAADHQTLESSAATGSLLQHAALAEFPTSKDLKQVFSKAMEELRDAIQVAETLDWKKVQSQWSDLPPKKPSVPVNGVAITCPDDDIAVNDNTAAMIPQDAARQADLDRYVGQVQALLSQRSKATTLDSFVFSQLLLPESLMSLERTTRLHVNEALEEIIATSMTTTTNSTLSSSSSNNNNKHCVTEEQVLDMVQEGLWALQRKADLRNVLRKKVLELDPTATAIILDADLGIPTPKIPIRQTKNLRRWVDTPLIAKLAQGIDQLVEWSGGHSDRLDQWLDAIVASQHERVGEMVVRRVLQESAHVEIPTMDTLKQKAQTLVSAVKKKSK